MGYRANIGKIEGLQRKSLPPFPTFHSEIPCPRDLGALKLLLKIWHKELLNLYLRNTYSMLTEKEAKENYDKLLAAITVSSIPWIITQIQEEIARGKEQTKSLKDIISSSPSQRNLFGKPEMAYGNIPSSSKDIMSFSEPYSDRERFRTLLDALQQISEVQTMKAHILTTLRSFNPAISSIEFAAEEETAPVESMTANSVREGQNVFEKLKSAIDQIKREI
jgi:hypothetical protein